MFKKVTASPNKQIIEGSIIYIINEDEKTASVFGHEIKYSTNILIPRTIKYEMQEYIVTNILEKSFYLHHFKSIEFPPDSEIQTIQKNAFFASSIECLSIPASLVTLEKGWCCGLRKLKTIKIDPNNKSFSLLKNQPSILIGNSDSKSDTHNTLYFAARNITNATIPPFIKRIGPYSFQNCQNLESIEVDQNSELQKIDEFSLSGSYIEKLSIPSTILKFKKGWCSGTARLTKINIFYNKNQKNIIYFKNKIIIGKSSKNSGVYDVLYFASRDIKTVSIPPFIRRIESNAFEDCKKLTSVYIQNGSDLKIIENNAFSFSAIKSVLIPFNVTEIGKEAFNNCPKLQIIEIEDGSKLHTVSKNAIGFPKILTISPKSKCISALLDMNL